MLLNLDCCVQTVLDFKSRVNNCLQARWPDPVNVRENPIGARRAAIYLMLKLAVGCLLSVVALAQRPLPVRLNNLRIIDLVQTGVSTQEIFRIIATVPKFDFDLRPVSTDAMLTAGVSEEIIQAMAAREAGTAIMEVVVDQLRAVPVVQRQPPITAPVARATASAYVPTTVTPALAVPIATSIPSSSAPSGATAFVARRPNEPRSEYGLLSEQEISEAIQGNSRHAAGLRLNDVQTRLLSGMLCKTCGASGYTTTIYTPQQWIAHAAQYARREMMPFSRAEVTDDMRQPLLHVEALPSSPDYLNANGFSMASSVHRIVLSDTARQITIQPLEVTHGRVETNSALRSATFGTAAASFLMADVERLRATDPKGEFFVVVVGRMSAFPLKKERLGNTI